MSSANVDIVRRCYEIWNSRDWSQVSELIDPAAEFDLSRNVFNPDVYHGYSGLERLTRGIEEVWDDFTQVATELIDAGDNMVVATVTMHGKGKGSGVDVNMVVFNVWTLRDSKVVRVLGGYKDRAEALAAAARDAG